MSRPPSSYLPDPSRWIETASSSKPRNKPTQRPLTSFAHGLATPPTSSGFKRSSHATTAGATANAGPGPSSASTSARWRGIGENDTPLPTTKQSNLKGFFTPPTTATASQKAKGKGKAISQMQDTTPLSQKAGSQPRGMLGFGTKKLSRDTGSKLKIHKDPEDFWGSGSEHDDELEEEEKQDLAPRSHRTRGKTQAQNRDGEKEVTSSSAKARSLRHSNSPELPRRSIVDRSRENKDDVSPRSSKRPRTRARSPDSPPLFNPPAPTHTPSPRHTVNQPSSSLRPITPVPDYVLDIHRQLCGQDSERMRRVKSPWKKRDPIPQPAIASGTPEAKKRKRAETTSKDEVDRRVWEKAHQDRHKTPDIKAKKLVELSSSSNPPSDDVERRVWNIIHVKSAEKKTLVKLSSSDPPSEVISSPTKKGKGKVQNKKAGPLSPLSTNRIPKKNPSLNDQMLVQASPIARPYTPSRKKVDRVISPLPRTSASYLSPTTSLKNNPRASPLRHRPLSRHDSPSPSPAHPSLDDKIIDIVDQVRENQAGLENALLSICDPATSQAYSHSRSQKLRSQGREGATTPHTQQPASPEHLLNTPQKRSPFLHAHHKLTPPKSGSKSAVDSPFQPQPHMVNRQQTLFVLPDPPRQPDFSPLISQGSKRAGWKPVEMEPETLVTWSMGGAGETLPPAEDEHEEQRVEVPKPQAQLEDERMEVDSQESQDAPLFGDAGSPMFTPPRRPGLVDRSSSAKSIEPTIFSQNFPVLVPTSPIDSPPPLSRTSSRNREKEGKELARLSSPPPALRTGKARSSWDHLSRGVLAGMNENDTTTNTPKATIQATNSQGIVTKRKSTSSQRHSQAGQQSKLAAFGFFGDKPQGKIGDFETKWEDEEDHDFHFEPQAEGSTPVGERIKGIDAGESFKRMARVPEAPYHPHLRPAGIRELERRERERAGGSTQSSSDTPFLLNINIGKEDEEDDLPLFDNHHKSDDSINTNTSGEGEGGSSSQLSNTSGGSGSGEGVKTPKEVRDWWDALGERRTSEFGTLD